jgi:hypothetical protein
MARWRQAEISAPVHLIIRSEEDLLSSAASRFRRKQGITFNRPGIGATRAAVWVCKPHYPIYEQGPTVPCRQIRLRMLSRPPRTPNGNLFNAQYTVMYILKYNKRWDFSHLSSFFLFSRKNLEANKFFLDIIEKLRLIQ